MKLNILNDNYLNQNSLYIDFKEGNIINNPIYRSDVTVDIGGLVPFPLYAGDSKNKEANLLEAFMIVEKHYLKFDRELILNRNFWHSLFLMPFRDYVIKKYPEVLESQSSFKTIVIKKFDWENYIYKAILASQYINDNIVEYERQKYYQLIIDNLDLFNYIIKYRIFRNDKFLVKVLKLIDKYPKLSELLKKKITGHPELGKDERYGRRVIFEFNKAHPVSLGVLMDDAIFEDQFFEYLEYYYQDTHFLKCAH